MICVLEVTRSLAGACSAPALGDFAALFSVATIDKGLLRTPVDPRDIGRCCQESVPARDRGIEALGDVLEDMGFAE